MCQQMLFGVALIGLIACVRGVTAPEFEFATGDHTYAILFLNDLCINTTTHPQKTGAVAKKKRNTS